MAVFACVVARERPSNRVIIEYYSYDNSIDPDTPAKQTKKQFTGRWLVVQLDISHSSALRYWMRKEITKSSSLRFALKEALYNHLAKDSCVVCPYAVLLCTHSTASWHGTFLDTCDDT